MTWVWLDRVATLTIVAVNTVQLWRLHRKVSNHPPS